MVGKPIHVDAPVPKPTQAHVQVQGWGLMWFRCWQMAEVIEYVYWIGIETNAHEPWPSSRLWPSAARVVIVAPTNSSSILVFWGPKLMKR